MYKVLKPFAGPAIIGLVEIGASMANLTSPFTGGLLIGVGVFWFVMALFSNKALLKRAPFLIEWMPFLDPTGGMRSDKSALSGKYINGHSFNILDVVHDGKIENRHFEDCDIYGPAVLFVDGIGHLVDLTFDKPKEGVFIAINQPYALGPIHVLNCTFKNIRLHRIGLIGTEQDRIKFMAAWKE